MEKDKTVILCKRKDKYEVYETGHGHGPWYQGSTFKISDKESVDGHFFVEHHHCDGNGNTIEKIVGIAHNSQELKSKLYECARNYCADIAKRKSGAEFIDETNKGNPTLKKFGG